MKQLTWKGYSDIVKMYFNRYRMHGKNSRSFIVFYLFIISFILLLIYYFILCNEFYFIYEMRNLLFLFYLQIFIFLKWLRFCYSKLS